MKTGVIIFLVLSFKFALAEAGYAYDFNLFVGTIILVLGIISGIIAIVNYIYRKNKRAEENKDILENPSADLN